MALNDAVSVAQSSPLQNSIVKSEYSREAVDFQESNLDANQVPIIPIIRQLSSSLVTLTLTHCINALSHYELTNTRYEPVRPSIPPISCSLADLDNSIKQNSQAANYSANPTLLPESENKCRFVRVSTHGKQKLIHLGQLVGMLPDKSAFVLKRVTSFDPDRVNTSVLDQLSPKELLELAKAKKQTMQAKLTANGTCRYA